MEESDSKPMASMMSAYSNGVPVALDSAIRHIKGVNVNTLSVSPVSGATSVASSGQIRVLLPSNSYYDLQSLKLHFSVTTTGTITKLPPVKTLFERVQVQCGGVTIYNSGSFFGQQEYCYSINENRPYNNVNDKAFIAVATDAIGGSATTRESYAQTLGANGGTLFSVDLGEFGRSFCPRIFNASIAPQMEVIFYLASNNVLMCSAGADAPGNTDGNSVTEPNGTTNDQTFSITNAVMLVNAYALSDNLFSLAQAQRMQDIGYVECAYKNTIPFNQSWNGSARFSLGCASLSKLTALWKLSTHSAVGAPVPLAGKCMQTNAGGTGIGSLVHYEYEGLGFVAKSGKVQLQAKFLQQQAPTATSATNAKYSTAGILPLTFQFFINASASPQTKLNQSQWLDQVKWANSVHDIDVTNLPEYLNNKFSIAQAYSLPTYPHQKRTVSGIDSRSTSSFFELRADNSKTDGTYDCLILAETDVMLRIGAGKSLQIIS